jgi:transposase
MPNVRDELKNLPTDVDALRALVLSITAERDALLEYNERLQHLLLKLKRLQFGRKSERLPEDQRQLALEDLEQAVAQVQATEEKRDPELRKQRVAQRRASREPCRRTCHASRSR